MTFIVLTIIVVIFSGILALLNFSVTYNALNSTKLDKYKKWVAHWTENCGYDKIC